MKPMTHEMHLATDEDWGEVKVICSCGAVRVFDTRTAAYQWHDTHAGGNQRVQESRARG